MRPRAGPTLSSLETAEIAEIRADVRKASVCIRLEDATQIIDRLVEVAVARARHCQRVVLPSVDVFFVAMDSLFLLKLASSCRSAQASINV